MQVVISEPPQPARLAVIWMHGLGASYEDMAALAEAIHWPNQYTRQVFLQAPNRAVTINAGMEMPAWYDIRMEDFGSRAEDYDGVSQSANQITEVIEAQLAQGIDAGQIYLAGFSQGGAMALYTGLSCGQTLGGILALSAYLPCADRLPQAIKQPMPVFLASGLYDPIVLPQWGQQSCTRLSEMGITDITQKNYPMEHAVCPEEVSDISTWLTQKMTEAIQ